MTRSESALDRLDRASSWISRYEPMSAGLPAARCRMLGDAGVTPHGDLVARYSDVPIDRLVYDSWVGELDRVSGSCGVGPRRQGPSSPVARARWDAQLDCACSGRTGGDSARCRPCVGSPPVAHLDGIFDAVPRNPPLRTLASVLMTWATRCELLYSKNPYSGDHGSTWDSRGPAPPLGYRVQRPRVRSRCAPKARGTPRRSTTSSPRAVRRAGLAAVS